MKCKEGYKLKDNKCNEESCILGDEDKCKTCKNEWRRIKNPWKKMAMV